MAQIYIADETKELLELLKTYEGRTQDGEIWWLCKQRANELGIEDGSPPDRPHKNPAE